MSDLSLLPEHMRLWVQARWPLTYGRVITLGDPGVPKRMLLEVEPEFAGLFRCAALTARVDRYGRSVFQQCRRAPAKGSSLCPFHRWLRRRSPSAPLDNDLRGWV